MTEGTPDYSGPHYTTIAALGLDGVTAPWIFEGAMTTLVFETYVEAELAPTLHRGDIVLADNLSAHKSTEAQRLIAQRGARLEFLPPYSADFNPIELCWSKVKTALRAAEARTWDALLEALAKALRSVSHGYSSLVRPLWLHFAVNQTGIRSRDSSPQSGYS